MRIKYLLTTLLSFLFLTTTIILAQEESQCFIDEHNAAIKGFDAVSYFTSNEAVKGIEKYNVTFDNAAFYFANNENKKLFKKDPMKYLPQYGGYCAFAMGAKNMKVPSNPETFEIVNGKLYLFYNDIHEGKRMNTKIMWDKDREAMNKMADTNWEKMMNSGN